MPITSTFCRLRQEDSKFKAGLSYIVSQESKRGPGQIALEVKALDTRAEHLSPHLEPE